MQIKFTESMLQKLGDALGFKIQGISVFEGDLQICGVDNAYAEAAITIDFNARLIRIYIDFINGEELSEEKEVRLDF